MLLHFRSSVLRLLAAATKSLDQSYTTTTYSEPWSPQKNAGIGDSAARVLPLNVLPARLLLAQMQLAVVPRDASLAGVAAQLQEDLEARYPPLSIDLDGVPLNLPPLAAVRDCRVSRGGACSPHTPPPPFAGDALAALLVRGRPRELHHVNAVQRPHQCQGERRCVEPARIAPHRLTPSTLPALQIWAAIVVNAAPPAFDYTIRMNSTGLPWTIAPPVNTLQRGTDLGNFQKYYAFTPTFSWGVRGGGAAWMAVMQSHDHPSPSRADVCWRGCVGSQRTQPARLPLAAGA